MQTLRANLPTSLPPVSPCLWSGSWHGCDAGMHWPTGSCQHLKKPSIHISATVTPDTTLPATTRQPAEQFGLVCRAARYCSNWAKQREKKQRESSQILLQGDTVRQSIYVFSHNNPHQSLNNSSNLICAYGSFKLWITHKEPCKNLFCLHLKVECFFFFFFLEEHNFIYVNTHSLFLKVWKVDEQDA